MTSSSSSSGTTLIIANSYWVPTISQACIDASKNSPESVRRISKSYISLNVYWTEGFNLQLRQLSFTNYLPRSHLLVGCGAAGGPQTWGLSTHYSACPLFPSQGLAHGCLSWNLPLPKHPVDMGGHLPTKPWVPLGGAARRSPPPHAANRGLPAFVTCPQPRFFPPHSSDR